VLGYPTRLLGQEVVLGAVLTRVSVPDDADLGGYKLAFLLPLHVRPALVPDESGGDALAFLGCQYDCPEDGDDDSLDEVVLTIPVLGLSPASDAARSRPLRMTMRWYIKLGAFDPGFTPRDLVPAFGYFTTVRSARPRIVRSRSIPAPATWPGRTGSRPCSRPRSCSRSSTCPSPPASSSTSFRSDRSRGPAATEHGPGQT
jgi:hypothetical protein